MHSLQMYAQSTSSPPIGCLTADVLLPRVALNSSFCQLLKIHNVPRVSLPGEFPYPSKKTTLACVSPRSYDIGAVTVVHLSSGWYLWVLRTAATSEKSALSLLSCVFRPTTRIPHVMGHSTNCGAHYHFLEQTLRHLVARLDRDLHLLAQAKV
jgi:hypothetical protein